MTVVATVATVAARAPVAPAARAHAMGLGVLGTGLRDGPLSGAAVVTHDSLLNDLGGLRLTTTCRQN